VIIFLNEQKKSAILSAYSAKAKANEIIALKGMSALAKTKEMLNREMHMDLNAALESEAQAQAICMQTKDYERAYEAFVAKQRPVFRGN